MRVSLKQSFFSFFSVFSSLLKYFNSIRELMNGDCLPSINNADVRIYTQKAISSQMQKTSEVFKLFVFHGYINAIPGRKNFLAIDKTYLHKIVNITIKIFVRNDATRDTSALIGGLKTFVRINNNFSCVVLCKSASIREY